MFGCPAKVGLLTEGLNLADGSAVDAKEDMELIFADRDEVEDQSNSIAGNSSLSDSEADDETDVENSGESEGEGEGENRDEDKDEDATEGNKFQYTRREKLLGCLITISNGIHRKTE